MAVSNLIRYLGPANERGPTTKISGSRQTSNTPGVITDLPDNSNDNHVFGANGWVRLGYVGTTAQRLLAPSAGTPYVDTTLSKMIVYDGANWRDPVTGSIV